MYTYRLLNRLCKNFYLSWRVFVYPKRYINFGIKINHLACHTCPFPSELVIYVFYKKELTKYDSILQSRFQDYNKTTQNTNLPMKNVSLLIYFINLFIFTTFKIFYCQRSSNGERNMQLRCALYHFRKRVSPSYYRSRRATLTFNAVLT